jgi:hypothetical protein
VSAAPATSAAGAAEGHLRVTQVRSGICTKPKHRGTLLARVPHLITVEPASEDEAADQRERSASALRARRVSQGMTDVNEAPAPAKKARRATKELA